MRTVAIAYELIFQTTRPCDCQYLPEEGGGGVTYLPKHPYRPLLTIPHTTLPLRQTLRRPGGPPRTAIERPFRRHRYWCIGQCPERRCSTCQSTLAGLNRQSNSLQRVLTDSRYASCFCLIPVPQSNGFDRRQGNFFMRHLWWWSR